MYVRLNRHASAAALTLCTAALLLTTLACGDSGGSANEGEVRCGRGEVLVRGRCVARDAVDHDDAGDDVDPQDALPDEDTTGSTCEEGALRCAGVARQRCGAAGWEDDPCGEGERCAAVDGQPSCVDEASVRCPPGEFIACASDATVRQCNAAGDDAETLACPAEAPRCLDALRGCSALACAPSLRYCDGLQVMECNSEGSDASIVTICDSDCRNGGCVNACLVDAGKGANVGCEFYAVWLDQVDAGPSSPTNAMAITVANTRSTAAQVVVTDPAGNLIAERDVPPSGLVRIDLPVSGFRARGTRIAPQSFRIQATGPVTVHQFNPPDNQGQYSNDASLLLPVSALGTDYVSIGWPTAFSPGFSNRSMVAVVAVAGGVTEVTVRPRSGIAAGGGQPALSANQVHRYQLDQGEVLYLQSEAATLVQERDLTGTLVTADQPVGVFSAHQCAFVTPQYPWCDHLEQQLIPTRAWGTSYVGAKFRPRGNEPDYYRLVALDDNTQITTQPAISNVNGRTLRSGEAITFSTRESFLLEATQRVQLAQFMVASNYGCQVPAANDGQTAGCAIPRICGAGSQDDASRGIGDPAFLLGIPTRQYITDYTFLVPNQYARNHISIISRAEAVLTFNGVDVSAPAQPIAGTPWVVRHMDVDPGVHRLTSDTPAGLNVYGYDCEVSYAYPGGMNVDGL